MIRIVPDCNVLISGFITPRGATRKIIDLKLAKKIELYGSEKTYKKFCQKAELNRIKKHFVKQHLTSSIIEHEYKFLINQITTLDILPGERLTEDPEDDEYIRVAIACGSKIIVSRDKHVLDVDGKYYDIRVITPEKYLKSRYRLNKGKLF